MKYVCNNNIIIQNLLKHINRKPICDIIYQILSSNFLNSLIRIEILLKFFSLFESSEEIIFCVSGLFEDILINNFLFDFILENFIIFEKIHSLLIKIPSNSIAYQELLRVLIKFYELFTNKNSKFRTFQFNKSIFETLEIPLDLIKNNFMNEFTKVSESTFSIHMKVLGLRRLYEFQFIIRVIRFCNNCLMFDMNNRDKISNLMISILTKDLFNTIIKYLFEFQWNNLYQNEFNLLLNEILSNETPKTLIEVYFKTDFLDTFMNKILDNGFEFKSGRRINSGFLGGVINVLELINNSENKTIKNLLFQNTRWEIFYQKIVFPITQKYKNGLCHNLITISGKLNNDLISKIEQNVTFRNRSTPQSSNLTFTQKLITISIFILLISFTISILNYTSQMFKTIFWK